MKITDFISNTVKEILFPFFNTKSKKTIAIEQNEYCDKHFISDNYCNDEFLFI